MSYRFVSRPLSVPNQSDNLKENVEAATLYSPFAERIARLRMEQKAIEEHLNGSQSQAHAEGLKASLLNTDTAHDTRQRKESLMVHVSSTEQQQQQNQRQRNSVLLTRYFNALSQFPNYEERRKKALETAQPFSFELRELQKGKSISTKRLEEELAKEEHALMQILNNKIVANPVPPSTFLPKYKFMVDEWSTRKETAAATAVTRRKENKSSRSCTAKQCRTLDGNISRQVVPLRNNQSDALTETNVESKGAYHGNTGPVPDPPAVPPPFSSILDPYFKLDTIGNSHCDPSLSAQEAAAQREKYLMLQRKQLREAHPHNPNFTFSPKINHSVPIFEQKWAEERLRLAACRLQKQEVRRALLESRRSPYCEVVDINRQPQSTIPKEFQLSLQKRVNRPCCRPVLEEEIKHSIFRSRTPPARPSQQQIPRCTHSHELKAASSYQKIINRCETLQRAESEERKRIEKQRHANKRMSSLMAKRQRMTGYTSLEDRTKAKVKALRESMIQQTNEYNNFIVSIKGREGL